MAVEDKPLPFRGDFKNRRVTPDLNTLIGKLKAAPTDSIVVDDAGYLSTHYFMNNHREKSGNKSFDMYDSIADDFYCLIKTAQALPKSKIVYIIMHEDTNDFGDTKLKTIGKLLDNKVCIEGMVTICIRCLSENGKHFFRVETDGSDITKTPEDMFEEPEMENDLYEVDKAIRAYWGLNNANS